MGDDVGWLPVTERGLSALTAFKTTDALRETQPFGFFCFSA